MNIDAIIKASKSLETLLVRKFNASGKGLHEKVSSIESKLSSDLIAMLRFVATIRNKALHEDNFMLSDAEMEIFLTKAHACELLLSNTDNQTSYNNPQPEVAKQNNLRSRAQIAEFGQSINLQPWLCVCGSHISMDYYNCSCGNNYFDINQYGHITRRGFLFNSEEFYCNGVKVNLSGSEQSELVQICNQLNSCDIKGLCCTRCGNKSFVVHCGVCNRAYFVDHILRMSSRSKSKGLCFISTAVFKSKGLPDDCEELALLRNFRDTFLLTTTQGRLLVEEYYRIAPDICKQIDSNINSDFLYTKIYDLFLHKIVDNIRSGADCGLIVSDYVAMVNFCNHVAKLY
ncbi:MAG TPA: hypothetical protein PKH37_04290 [Alphaproteobacteria bacterium]|nr:hypothetical protein [Alphaproteobacteria bacterium]